MAQDYILAATAAASGVPTPPLLTFTAKAIEPPNTSVELLAANHNRTFLLIYNVTAMVMQFSIQGPAVQGALSNLSIGPGQAFFQAGTVYQGAVSAVSQFGVLPLWAWEDGSNLYNNGGALAITSPPAGYPTAPNGLPPGAVWNDGLEIAVIPGITPDPTAPPLVFGTVTAQQLLSLGGGNLPLSNPGPGSLQLWNDGGVVAIA